jgi:hypothetical protein
VNPLRIRWWLSALLLIGAFLLLPVLARTGGPAAFGQSSTPGAVTAPAPDWAFVVHGMQDPYAGVLTNPQEPAPGMRYVAFEVEVVNASDQPLSFANNAVHLWDDEGFSYRSGAVTGSEPALPGRTLPGGERARGWVWFAVPEDVTLTDILLVPSAPELRVGLDELESIAGATGSATTPGITPTPATETQPATEPAPPPATESPPAATSTAAPVANQAPTSVITIESAETPAGSVSATATPRPAVTATPRPVVTSTPAIVTSVPTATPPPSESVIEPGSTVITADSDVNLRDGPSLDAAVIGIIPLGAELTVTGPAEAEGDMLWWPVLVVATGEEGYVAGELLTPLGES